MLKVVINSRKNKESVMPTLLANRPSDLFDFVGHKLGPTQSIVVDQARIDQFAEATGDHQWIHVDPVRAAEGPFGKTIAHGYLTLSLANLFLPELIRTVNFSMGVNYGADNIRFPATVPVDSKVFATGEVLSVDEAKGGVRLVVRVSVSVEGSERPACIVDTISLMYP
jgi:acyl dehydratase